MLLMCQEEKTRFIKERSTQGVRRAPLPVPCLPLPMLVGTNSVCWCWDRSLARRHQQKPKMPPPTLSLGHPSSVPPLHRPREPGGVAGCSTQVMRGCIAPSCPLFPADLLSTNSLPKLLPLTKHHEARCDDWQPVFRPVEGTKIVLWWVNYGTKWSNCSELNKQVSKKRLANNSFTKSTLPLQTEYLLCNLTGGTMAGIKNERDLFPGILAAEPRWGHADAPYLASWKLRTFLLWEQKPTQTKIETLTDLSCYSARTTGSPEHTLLHRDEPLARRAPWQSCSQQAPH